MADDGNSFSPNTILAALGGVVTALVGAWALYQKTKGDSRQQAASTAQTTVQGTLDAMKMVVDGLTHELDRRQKELDIVRGELSVSRTRERELEILSARQETRITVLETRLEELKRRLDTLEGRSGA